MILYLDASALVKLYAREAGSTDVKAAVAQADIVATSLIAYVEARSAFARKHRLAEMSDTALGRHKRELEQDWSRLNRLPVDSTTIRRAGDLAEQYRLRAYEVSTWHRPTCSRPRPVPRSPSPALTMRSMKQRAGSVSG